ncbi:PIF1 protein [Hirsutella rhossiliensis]
MTSTAVYPAPFTSFSPWCVFWFTTTGMPGTKRKTAGTGVALSSPWPSISTASSSVGTPSLHLCSERKTRAAVRRLSGTRAPPLAPFGYITKFTVDNKTRSGISYRKHVKGHIVVFPNKVDDLVTTVLPHPLLQTIENIHVSWSGSAKPGSADVRHLLQVRKSRVAAALAWLQRNNPLYENIAIDQAEMDGWRYADGSTVPTVIMDRMQRGTVDR